MKLKDAKKIVKLLKEHNVEATFHRRYSGRGMFGEATAAVSGDPAVIGWAAGKLDLERPSWRRDAMGFDTVVY